MQIFAGITVVSLMLIIGLLFFYLERDTKNLQVPFEDPIASEFFRLDCISESQKALEMIMSLHTKNDEISSISGTTVDYFKSDSSEHEIAFFLKMNRYQQLLQMWKMKKDKEYQKVTNSIIDLESKLSNVRFQKNRNIISGNIKTYHRYKEFLDEYERTMNLMSTLNYDELSKFKRYTSSSYNETIAEGIKLSQNIILVQLSNDLLEQNIINTKLLIKSTREQHKVVEQTTEYLNWIAKIDKWFFFYYHQME